MSYRQYSSATRKSRQTSAVVFRIMCRSSFRATQYAPFWSGVARCGEQLPTPPGGHYDSYGSIGIMHDEAILRNRWSQSLASGRQQAVLAQVLMIRVPCRLRGVERRHKSGDELLTLFLGRFPALPHANG